MVKLLSPSRGAVSLWGNPGSKVKGGGRVFCRYRPDIILKEKKWLRIKHTVWKSLSCSMWYVYKCFVAIFRTSMASELHRYNNPFCSAEFVHVPAHAHVCSVWSSLQYGAECIVVLLAFIYGQIIVDHTILPDVHRCQATSLVVVADVFKHRCSRSCRMFPTNMMLTPPNH